MSGVQFGMHALQQPKLRLFCQDSACDFILCAYTSSVDRKPLCCSSFANRTVLLGIAVGMTATCFNAPFDVVKSRFQSQMPDNRKYKSTVGALATIYREEGPQVGQAAGTILYLVLYLDL